MSANTLEWLVVAIFFACFFAYTFLETGWLNKKNGIPFGRALAFSFATNILCISVGFFISFIIFGVLLALAWDGTLGQVDGNDWRIWAASLTGAFAPLLLLIVAKRVGLRLIGPNDLGLPWLYSAASSVIFLLFVVSVPVLFAYFS
ncbi:MAG: hypothetical protein IPM25_06800 [Chloracidobacterium sp.]|nr:hypothetical protein [Chloracidobacterium sp.]